MGLSRFELLTPRLSSVCSNQLSYRPGILFKELTPDLFTSITGAPVLSKLDSPCLRRHNQTSQIDLRMSTFFEIRPKPDATENALERR